MYTSLANHFVYPINMGTCRYFEWHLSDGLLHYL